MSQERSADVIVAGTGPAGLLAALAVAREGFGVALVGPPARTGDLRTTALMLPALDVLDRLGVLDALRPDSAPLRAMRIVDATARLVRSPTVTFRAAEIGRDAFGLNIPNAALNPALEDAVRGEPGIVRHEDVVESWHLAPDGAEARLAGGGTLRARLVAAADGRESAAREAAGIATRERALPQAALVLAFAHAREHGDTSTEFHTEDGPFTQVPLPGRRSSLVWVAAPAEADRLAGLGDEALGLAIEERMQSMLGRVAPEPGRRVHPLSMRVPESLGRNRVALVGEAAHVFPPIGAQGLNLGIRDVEALARMAARHRDDPGAPAALAAYRGARRMDVALRSGAVDLLNRSLLSSMLPAQLVRSAGLGALGRIAPLRSFFMREGMSPGSGFSGALASLREQVRRQ